MSSGLARILIDDLFCILGTIEQTHSQDLSKPLLLSTSMLSMSHTNCKKGQTTTTTEHHPRPARWVVGCQGLRKLPARRRRRSRYYIKPFFTALQLQSQCLQGNRLYNFTLATTREMTDEMLMHEVIVQRPTIVVGPGDH